jgi:succinate dehydrogenase/fumarate reductase cytochrome b subunit
MAKTSSTLMQLVTLLLILPAIVTVVVGIDFLLEGLGIDVIEINLPRRGLWGVFIGACCLGTGWIAKQGLAALWKKL